MILSVAPFAEFFSPSPPRSVHRSVQPLKGVERVNAEQRRLRKRVHCLKNNWEVFGVGP